MEKTSQSSGVKAIGRPETASQNASQDAVSSMEAKEGGKEGSKEGSIMLFAGLFPVCKYRFKPEMNCDCDVPFEPFRE